DESLQTVIFECLDAGRAIGLTSVELAVPSIAVSRQLIGRGGDPGARTINLIVRFRRGEVAPGIVSAIGALRRALIGNRTCPSDHLRFSRDPSVTYDGELYIAEFIVCGIGGPNA